MTDTTLEALWEAMTRCPVLMLALRHGEDHAEPMMVRFLPEYGDRFWIYTNTANRLAPGGTAVAQFVSPGHDLFASLSGTLRAETDPEKRERTWSRAVEAWYPGGPQDPTLLMMRFDLEAAELWTQDASIRGLFKLMSGKPVSADALGTHKIVRLSDQG